VLERCLGAWESEVLGSIFAIQNLRCRAVFDALVALTPRLRLSRWAFRIRTCSTEVSSQSRARKNAILKVKIAFFRAVCIDCYKHSLTRPTKMQS
jgi:hypothetical protein